MRTYGTLRRAGADWVAEADPHVAIRLKRVFHRAGHQYGKIRLSITAEVCRDLAWFVERFPLEMSAADKVFLRGQADDFDRAAEAVAKVLAGSSLPRHIDLALPLRQYQLVAAEVALRVHGLLLADDVGLGKTASAIGMLAGELNTLPALVVTLAHLPSQWKAEIERFAPTLRVHVLKKGTPYDLRERQRRRRPDTTQLALVPDEPRYPDVIISNYHKLAGWAETLSGKVHTVVFDEGQELRRSDSAKYKAARHISSGATWRVSLSATPIYNYGEEFYNVLDVLRPGAMGTKTEFIQEWCTGGYGEGKAKIRDPRAFGTYLREQALMLRRTRAEVGRELPEVTVVPQYLDCDTRIFDDAKGTAMALANVLLAKATAWDERGRAARELDAQLRQATGLAKAPAVADFVRMLVENGEKVVLYGWHHAVYDIWEHRLRDLGVAKFTGTESSAQKEVAKEQFLRGDVQVLIMSLRAGAGLDGLQDQCHIVVFGELDWSPGVHTQCIGRIHRDGQGDSVIVYYLLSDDGADPIMVDVLGIKRGQLEAVRDPGTSLVEQLQVDDDHVKRLARAYLARHGAADPEETIPERAQVLG
jgi:SNF2 family DNA or RNA helicase